MTEPTGWPHMLPCPFCGGDARHDAHADDCYFILHRKFKNSGADMSPAFEVLAAWNRRTPQPTQPQAGAVPQYRLLQPGVDRIEDDDEFLSDDTTTWAIDPNGIFSGNIYGGHVLRPARRRIKGGQHGAEY